MCISFKKINGLVPLGNCLDLNLCFLGFNVCFSPTSSDNLPKAFLGTDFSSQLTALRLEGCHQTNESNHIIVHKKQDSHSRVLSKPQNHLLKPLEIPKKMHPHASHQKVYVPKAKWPFWIPFWFSTACRPGDKLHGEPLGLCRSGSKHGFQLGVYVGIRRPKGSDMAFVIQYHLVILFHSCLRVHRHRVAKICLFPHLETTIRLPKEENHRLSYRSSRATALWDSQQSRPVEGKAHIFQPAESKAPSSTFVAEAIGRWLAGARYIRGFLGRKTPEFEWLLSRAYNDLD